MAMDNLMKKGDELLEFVDSKLKVLLGSNVVIAETKLEYPHRERKIHVKNLLPNDETIIVGTNFGTSIQVKDNVLCTSDWFVDNYGPMGVEVSFNDKVICYFCPFHNLTLPEESKEARKKATDFVDKLVHDTEAASLKTLMATVYSMVLPKDELTDALTWGANRCLFEFIDIMHKAKIVAKI